MFLPIDEAGWTGRGLMFLVTGDHYRFLVPPAPGVPGHADAVKARDLNGALVLANSGAEQIDLSPDRYSPHRALYKLLTGADAPVE